MAPGMGTGMSTSKGIYEALQTLNAELSATQEEYLVDLVQKIVDQTRTDAANSRPTGPGGTVSATLKNWLEWDARYEPEEILPEG